MPRALPNQNRHPKAPWDHLGSEPWEVKKLSRESRKARRDQRRRGAARTAWPRYEYRRPPRPTNPVRRHGIKVDSSEAGYGRAPRGYWLVGDSCGPWIVWQALYPHTEEETAYELFLENHTPELTPEEIEESGDDVRYTSSGAARLEPDDMRMLHFGTKAELYAFLRSR